MDVSGYILADLGAGSPCRYDGSVGCSPIGAALLASAAWDKELFYYCLLLVIFAYFRARGPNGSGSNGLSRS